MVKILMAASSVKSFISLIMPVSSGALNKQQEVQSKAWHSKNLFLRKETEPQYYYETCLGIVVQTSLSLRGCENINSEARTDHFPHI